MIGIIDYGMGNLRSVQKALERVGAAAAILETPEQLSAEVERLILPGVGAFADGMEQIEARGWRAPIHAFLKTGRPFLGICLGMQLLFESSQEDAPSPQRPVAGLGVLPGRVVRFSEDRGGKRVKVPHMGWNTLAWDRSDPLLAGLDQGAAVYFVHSYYVDPTETQRPLASAWSDYGGAFCASVWDGGHIWATQFHPEKSQRVGLHLLANFTRQVPANTY